MDIYHVCTTSAQIYRLLYCYYMLQNQQNSVRRNIVNIANQQYFMDLRRHAQL